MYDPIRHYEVDGTKSAANISSYFLSGLAVVGLSLSCQDFNLGMPKRIRVVNSLRIIFYVTCVFGMLNFYTYSVGLISHLMIEIYKLPINDLKDFVSKQSDYHLMIMNGDGFELYFSQANNWPLNKIWNEKMKNNPDAYVSSAIEGDNVLMRNPKSILLLTPDSALGLPNYPCNIVRARKEYSRKSVAYAFKKHSVYVGVFSKFITDFNEYGNMHYIEATNERYKPSLACTNDKEYRPLGYVNIFYLFIVLFAGIVCSGTYAFIESMYYKYTR